MLTVQTVFVLGAGASKPYGYPLGKDLKDYIIQTLSDDRRDQFQLIRKVADCEPRDIEFFRDALFFSGTNSVDAFLEHRTDFINIGKAAIAQVLMTYEDEKSLFENKEGKWYQYFFEKLNAPFGEFDKNTIGIITFNYDRSFEQYLFIAMQNLYGVSANDAACKLNKIPIVHVHGQLGPLPWQNKNGRPYYYSGILEHIQQAASGIRIISENIDINNDPQFNEAHTLLKEAQRIFFLGFGYNEANIQRLGPGFFKRRVKGTALGLEKAERGRAELSFRKHQAPIDFSDENVDILLYLRRHVDFF